MKGELKKELKEAQEEANNELVVLVAGQGDKKREIQQQRAGALEPETPCPAAI